MRQIDRNEGKRCWHVTAKPHPHKALHPGQKKIDSRMDELLRERKKRVGKVGGEG